MEDQLATVSPVADTVPKVSHEKPAGGSLKDQVHQLIGLDIAGKLNYLRVKVNDLGATLAKKKVDEKPDQFLTDKIAKLEEVLPSTLLLIE